jgi:type III secretion protein Q
MNTLSKKPKGDIYHPDKLSMTDVLIDNLLSTKTSTIYSENSSAHFCVKTKSLSKDLEYKKYIGICIWGEPAMLMLPYLPFPETVKKITTDEELSEIPKALALVTLAVLYEEYIAELSKALSTEITLTDFFSSKSSFEKSDDYKHRIHFCINSETETGIDGCFLFGNHLLQKVFHYINEVPSVFWFSLQKIDTCLFYEAGETVLTKEELSSLESGDIIMIESSSQYDEKHLIIRLPSGHKFLAKAIDSLSYSILDEIMEDDINDQNISLDEIPLAMTFDLGGRSISLDELNQLGVGYTLELKKNFTDLVTIRINNKKIGKGEIVDIGNRAGVRITHLDNK